MSINFSDNVGREQAKKKARKFGRRGAILGLALAVVTASGAAWAAMVIFGTGTVKADAYEAKALVVSEEKFSGPIFPGAELDMTFTVSNPNPFPVKISKLELDGDPQKAVTGTCVQGNNLSVLTTKLPIAGVGTSIPAASQVIVPANGSATVTLADAVQYDKGLSKTTGCTLIVKFKVTGTQSGN